MRTKLFFAFLAVVLTALVSNLIFKRLIIEDFREYADGVREDRLYWVLASVEGSYMGGAWDMNALRHYLPFATMLGYEVEVVDVGDRLIITSNEALESITPAMRRRIEAMVTFTPAAATFEEFPLYGAGEEIGLLRARPLVTKGFLVEKEATFKARGKEFLYISFAIAGGGAMFLAVVLSLFLTRPVRRLKSAADAVAGGDLGVRVEVFSRDEIGSLARSFNRMVEALERDEALRRRLSANIAHELRTPLAIARAHLEAMADGVVPCSVEEFEKLLREIARLTNLVEGIEDITKAEASFFKPAVYEVMDLGGFISEVVEGMQAVYREKGIALSGEAQPGLAVETDLAKLDIIVRNILGNALRHTESGSVTVRGGLERGDEFFVEVRDTGPGIPPEELPLIFRRFYKGDGSTGQGLGLAIARELVEVMGGSISAESAPEEGATFRVVLPLRPGAARPA